jgi:hypothetical protein
MLIPLVVVIGLMSGRYSKRLDIAYPKTGKAGPHDALADGLLWCFTTSAIAFTAGVVYLLFIP